ncbi:hypothetical protein Tco_1459837 [Tanacetum coccineum]
MALPPGEQRHRFLRYEGMEYPNTDIADFKGRLAKIYRREVHKVPVFDFEGLPDLMAEGLSGRMLMEHRDEADVSVFTSRAWRRIRDIRLGGARRRMSWRQFVLALGLHTEEEMQKARLCHRLIAYSIVGRSQAPEKVTVTYLFYLKGMDVDSVNVPYILARLAEHFGLLTAEILGGLTIIALELPIIDMTELPFAAAGAPAVTKDALIIDEGGQADPAPEQAPQQPPPPSPTTARTIPQRLRRLEEDVQGLRRDVGSLRGLVERSMTGVRWDFLRELTRSILETDQTEDWRGQHLRSTAGPVAA